MTHPSTPPQEPLNPSLCLNAEFKNQDGQMESIRFILMSPESYQEAMSSSSSPMSSEAESKASDCGPASQRLPQDGEAG